MFWLIQIGHISWYPNDLLDCFWKCLKFLLQNLFRGVLSNFFIPQNMFASKLATAEGVETLKSLSEKINGYYEIGVPVSCLLLSPTLRSIIEPVTSLHDRYLRIESRVGHAISLAELDKGINIEVHRMTFPVKGIIKSDTYLQSICSISQLSLAEYQTLIVQNCFVYVLIETAFQSINISSNCNRKLYRLDKLICSFLKTAGGQGDVSKFLYLAMYYYRTCRFREVLGVTAAVKSKLIQP